MAKGKVLWFNDEKGYGEILDRNGEKYFAHYVEIKEKGEERKSLEEGQEVLFQVGDLPAIFPYDGVVGAAKSIRVK